MYDHRDPESPLIPKATQDIQIRTALLTILSSHRGHENRISRKDLRLTLSLAVKVSIADRHMRRVIEELRTEDQRGAYIVADTEEGGYFMARDLVELDQFLSSDESRIRKLATRIHRQRQRAGLSTQAGQIPLL